MIAYHGLCFWRDSMPLVRDMPFSPQIWTQSVDQMACRLIMQIVNPLEQPQSTAGSLRGTAEEVECDTIQICTSFINSHYERNSLDQPSGSFVDAYDILSAAVILTCLHCRLKRQEPQHFANLMNSINKATAIVTQVAGRFTALKAFQDTLLKLSAHVVEAQYNTDQVGQAHLTERTRIDICTPLQTAQKPLRDIPPIVPRRLRRFLSGTFS